MSEINRKIVNQLIVSRLSSLHHMYKQAAIEARREREEQLFNDWTEWAELDEESKQYVRDYLSDE